MPVYLNFAKSQLIKSNDNGYLYVSAISTMNKLKLPYLPLVYKATNITATSFSLDSKYFFFSYKSTLRALNLENGGYQDIYNYSYDISRICALTTNTILVISKAFLNLFSIDKMENQNLENSDQDYINSIAYDSLNSKIYIAGTMKKIKIFTRDPFEYLAKFGEQDISIQQLVLLQSEPFLVSRDNEKIIIWNTLTLEREIEIKEKGAINITPTKDDKHLLISKNDFTIIVFSIKLQNILNICSFSKSFCYGVYHTNNRKYLIIAGTDYTLKILDYETFTCISSTKVQGEITFLRVSEDEKHLAYKINEKTINFYIIANPLESPVIQTYGSQSNFHNFIKYYLDIKDRKAINYDENMDKTVIMPFKITMLHMYAYYGQDGHIKNSLNNDSGFSDDSNGSSPLDLALKMNHKNSILAFIKGFIKKLETNPFITNRLTSENLIEINKLGFSALKQFYDSVLSKNLYSVLPLSCSRAVTLPKYFIHENVIPNKSWFIPSEKKEEGMTIEFYTSSICLNMIVGSEESILFIKSIIACPDQSILTSAFIQSYISNKWRRLRIFIDIEFGFYLLYIVLLWFIAFNNSVIGINTLFFIVGFLLSFYEVLQIFGGIKDYFLDTWNYIDTCRTVFLIAFADSMYDNSLNYDSIFLVLCLVSMARGISYFRIASPTRYQINLIFAVLKDIFPFLIILTYSTLAFGFLLMVMTFSGTGIWDYIVISWIADTGNLTSSNYTSIQWVLFIFGTILNPVILINLLISLMVDTHDKVQENKEVADLKEIASMVLEVEIAAIWRRHLQSKRRLHLCKEVDAKSESSNWLGKVREIKMMITNVKQSQLKMIESDIKLLNDDTVLKDQLTRVEKVIGGIKDKILNTSGKIGGDVTCTNGHKLVYQYLFDQEMVCSKCNKNNEVGYYCNICNFSLCKTCYKSVYKQKLVKIDITCYRFHQLTWIQDHSQYQNYDQKVFPCVGCKKKLYKDSFNCKKCKWDICFKCIDIICTKISISWTKSCGNDHPLQWNPRPHSENYKCDACSQVFQRSGSFRCNLCDYDLCIRCFDELA